METSRNQPRHTTEQAPAPNTPEADRRAKEQTDKEIAERVASPPEQPTPTQAEADAFKEGAAEPPAEPPPEARHGETAHQRREREEKERQQRDVKPEQGRSGYQTRT